MITAPQPPITLDDGPVAVPTPFLDFPPAQPTGDGFGEGTQPEAKPSPRFSPVSAEPTNDPGRWVTPDDYPSRDLLAGHQGVTGFRVIVSSSGRVVSCEVTRPSGFPALDKAACTYVTRRARFEPATDDSGTKVVGSYSSSVRWQIPR